MSKNPLESTLRKHTGGHGKTFLAFAMFTILILGISSVSAIDFGDAVGYWSFDEGAGNDAADSTPNGNNLIGVGSPGWDTGLLGEATDLSGSNWWINATEDIAQELMLGFPLTVNAWFKTDTLDANLRHIIRSDDINAATRYYLRTTTDGQSLEARAGLPGVTTIGTEGIVTGQWYMATLTINSTDMYLYVNGELNQTTSGSFSNTSAVSKFFSIGSDGSGTLEFNGLIDETSVWGKDLSPSEIIELYNSGTPLPFPSSELTVTLLSPEDVFSSGDKAFNFTAMANATNFNLTNATFNIWFPNSTLFNTTFVNITGDGNVTSNITTQEINAFEIGNFVWNTQFCGVNTTGTFCTEATNNFTLQIGAEILSNSFDGEVYETQSSTFYINISIIEGATLFAARLVYNGTSLLATKEAISSSTFAISRTIDIPKLPVEVVQNLSFFWEFEYRNGFAGSQNSSVFSHIVNPLIFVDCNATYETVFWNFTTRNETDRGIINNTVDATFEFWLGGGTIIKNYSLDGITSPTSRSFCGNLNDTPHNISAIINIESPGFFERTFYFNKEKINNTQTNTDLFLQDSGTAVIVEVTDPGLKAVVGHYINVYRFYPDIGRYLIIERALTDEFGEIVARLIEPNTIKYQFEFLDTDNNILKRTDDMTIACRNAFCVIPFVIEDLADDFARFQNTTDFDFSLSFSNTTNIFTYTWNDVTGSSITSRLLVQRIEFNGTSTVCNQTSTSSSSSLICEVGSDNIQYRVQAFRTVAGSEEQRVAILNLEVGDTAGIFGLEGLFWAFILLFTLIGVGSFNPSLGVGLYTIGFIALGVLGVISANIPIYFATGVMGVIFIWAIRS